MSVSVINSGHALSSSSGAALALGCNPSGGSNRIIICVVHVIRASGGAPAGISSVVRGVKTFTEVTGFRESWSTPFAGQGRFYAFYLLEADIVGGSININVTFDGGVYTYAFGSMFVASGAYQGAPADSVFAYADRSFGPFSEQLVDTDAQGKSVWTGYTMESTSLPSSYPNMVDFVGGLAAGFSSLPGIYSGLTTGGSGSLSEGVHTVGFGWEENTTGNPTKQDAVMSVVAINSTAWTPASPGVDPDTFCTNISNVSVIALRTVISGLDHLVGETVGILADGIVLSQTVLAAATMTLNAAAAVTHIGLPYFSDLETLNIEAQSRGGTLQGKKVKIGHVAFRVVDTRGGYIGPNEAVLYEAFTEARTGEADGVIPPPLYTGDIRVPLGAGYEDGGRIFYRQVDPLPVTISAVIPEINAGGPGVL